MKKIILLNGPPRSGKDYAGGLLQSFIGRDVSRIVKMAKEVKERTHALYRLTDMAGNVLPHDFFENQKDEKVEGFQWVTPRAAYIAFSEMLIKPLHGDKQFGIWLADYIDGCKEEVFLVTDSGFRGEAEVMVARFGAANCLLVRIHRAGYTFDGDSRGYIDLSDLGVKCLDIHNTGAAFYDRLSEIL